jgi:hypothetical protein
LEQVVRFKVTVTIEVPLNPAVDKTDLVLKEAAAACEDPGALEMLFYGLDNPITKVELLEAPRLVEVR